MESLPIARAIHVLAVVLWIGGVAMVTTVILPSLKRFESGAERIALFERIEHRFAWQARITTLVAGLSGFHMIGVMHAWVRYGEPAYWWLHLMTLVWAIFMLMLFVLEPFVLHRVIRERAEKDPEGTFTRIQRLHWVLLTLSLAAIAGAVAGSHGWVF